MKPFREQIAGTRRAPLRGAALLLVPATALLIVTLAAPLGLLAAYSFWTQHGLAIDTHPSFAQFATVLASRGFLLILLRSIAISFVATVAAISLAYPMAWFIAFRARGKFIWLLLVTIPFWTSYLLRVFAWKVILGYNGAINSALLALHLVSEPLAALLYTPWAVVFTLTYGYAAFAVLPIYVSLEKIDPALLEAAADLGDSPVRRFMRVTVPLSAGGVLAAFVLIFIPATGDYVTPTLVGGPDGLMIANLIQAQFGRAGNWPLGAALAVTAIAATSAVAAGLAAGAKFAVSRIR